MFETIVNFLVENRMPLFIGLIGLALISIIIIIIRAIIRHIKEKDNWENPRLVKKGEREYTLKEEERITMEQTRRAVTNVPNQIRNRLSLDPAWVSKINRLVWQANTLYENSRRTSRPPSERNYRYFKSFYYRSVSAGKMLHNCEKSISSKIQALNSPTIRSKFASNDINYLMRMLDGALKIARKQRQNAWNNTHNLKQKIAKCGKVGRNWFIRHEERRKVKYGS